MKLISIDCGIINTAIVVVDQRTQQDYAYKALFLVGLQRSTASDNSNQMIRQLTKQY